MKKIILIVSIISIAQTTFSQQSKKTTTTTKKEVMMKNGVNNYNANVAKESNAVGQDALNSLKDTSLTDSEREVYINNYRHGIRNGNPAIKKKSYDLTDKENYDELMKLSKSPKFNKKTQAVCVKMSNFYLPPGEYKNRLMTKLNDTTLTPAKRDAAIDEYVALVASSDRYGSPTKEETLAQLLYMTTAEKFNKQTQTACLEKYNKLK